MSANELLLWMSAKGQGSWQQFRTAVEELHLGPMDGGDGSTDESADPSSLPLYQELRLNLQRLGHAEFFSGGGEAEWRVCPPSIAVREESGRWIGIVSGARSTSLLRRVESAAGPIPLERQAIEGCPDRIQLQASAPLTLAGVAERAGILIQNDAAGALLASLPPVDSPSVRRPAELPLGKDWKIEKFSSSRLVWRETNRKEATSGATALLRFTLRHQRLVMLLADESAFQIPGQVGKYVMLKKGRRKVIRYDVARRQMSFPSVFRPPFLVERALIACSGLPPEFERDDAGVGVLHYGGVNREIAHVAAGLLRQEIR